MFSLVSLFKADNLFSATSREALKAATTAAVSAMAKMDGRWSLASRPE